MSVPAKIIFVVDDDVAHLRSLERVLKRAGFAVVTAVDGAAALRVLAQSSVDVLLIDLMMPEKDGFEILMELRKKQSRIPIVTMSGSGDPGSRSTLLTQSRMLGAVTALAKPISGPELLDAIDQALGECRDA